MRMTSELSKTAISRMRVADLKKELARRGLEDTGLRPVLQARLGGGELCMHAHTKFSSCIFSRCMCSFVVLGGTKIQPDPNLDPVLTWVGYGGTELFAARYSRLSRSMHV